MNFLQFFAFIIFWHLNRHLYRDLVHVCIHTMTHLLSVRLTETNSRHFNLDIGQLYHGLDFIIRAQN